MSAESRCRGCGGVLPGSALRGLCPVCLLREGLNGDDSAPNDSGFPANPARGRVTAGVRGTLAETLGTVPQTLLRDTDPGPMVLPGSPEMPAAGDRSGRLQLLGEIARGGMGAVLKGRDNDIGRDLAVKVSARVAPRQARPDSPIHRGGTDRRPVAAPGNRADLRARYLRRSAPLFRDEAGQGPDAVEPPRRATRSGARPAHAISRSSRPSARRWLTRTLEA